MTDDVLLEARDDAGEVRTYCFWCPGCRSIHQVHKGVWTFNGDLVRPTFSPSYLVYGVPEIGRPRCHSFITSGKIAYCSDSTHAMAGQTVDLPPFGDFKERIRSEAP